MWKRNTLISLIYSTSIIIAFLLLSWWYKNLNICLSQSKKTKDQFSSYIGKQYILNKDTLIIVDGSMILQTYTLSNGVTISCKLVYNK